MKQDGTLEVPEIMAYIETLWPWEKQQIVEKLLTTEIRKSIVSNMELEEICNLTSFYCYEEERKLVEDYSLDEVMKYFSKSEVIEWLIKKGAGVMMFTMLCERGIIKKEV